MLRTGTGAGVTGTPAPNHRRRRAGLPATQRGPASLPRGRAGQKASDRRHYVDHEETSWNQQGRELPGSVPAAGPGPAPAPALGTAGEPVGLLVTADASPARERRPLPHQRKSRRVPARRGLGHPGGGDAKAATVWGSNIQNGKRARKLYSIFPVKVIILHRTKRKGAGGR